MVPDQSSTVTGDDTKNVDAISQSKSDSKNADTISESKSESANVGDQAEADTHSRNNGDQAEPDADTKNNSSKNVCFLDLSSSEFSSDEDEIDTRNVVQCANLQDVKHDESRVVMSNKHPNTYVSVAQRMRIANDHKALPVLRKMPELKFLCKQFLKLKNRRQVDYFFEQHRYFTRWCDYLLKVADDDVVSEDDGGGCEGQWYFGEDGEDLRHIGKLPV